MSERSLARPASRSSAQVSVRCAWLSPLCWTELLVDQNSKLVGKCDQSGPGRLFAGGVGEGETGHNEALIVGARERFAVASRRKLGTLRGAVGADSEAH